MSAESRLPRRKNNYVDMEKLSLYIIFGLLYTAYCGVDRTIQRGASGAGVVQATISKIESSGIFPSDKRLLRRIAYVETREGEETPSESNFGGIWKVSEEMFAAIKTNYTLVALIDAAFSSELAGAGVKGWEELRWEALNIPLWSGIAARASLPPRVRIPTSSDISGQARFWATYYNRNGNVQKFIADATQLQTDEECNIKSDVIFVLDSSGSIGSSNYREVIEFTRRFVQRLEIGPTSNQVGVIIYSRRAEAVFNLNTYSTSTQILSAINRIPYIGLGTNTADGLCLMLQGFSEENGGIADHVTVAVVSSVVSSVVTILVVMCAAAALGVVAVLYYLRKKQMMKNSST